VLEQKIIKYYLNANKTYLTCFFSAKLTRLLTFDAVGLFSLDEESKFTFCNGCRGLRGLRIYQHQESLIFNKDTINNIHY